MFSLNTTMKCFFESNIPSVGSTDSSYMPSKSERWLWWTREPKAVSAEPSLPEPSPYCSPTKSILIARSSIFQPLCSSIPSSIGPGEHCGPLRFPLSSARFKSSSS
ncbi:hypothetical protein V6Z11_A01G172500 [Gossypium hirsutum]